jgi:hypothetical protein
MRASFMRIEFRDPSGFTIARIFLDIIIGTFAIRNALPGLAYRPESLNQPCSILSVILQNDHSEDEHCHEDRLSF